jgi:H+-transporting ATPase
MFPFQNIIWFMPLDWIKFGMKATIIRRIRERREAKARTEVPLPITRTQSIHESMYSNRVSFIKRAARQVGLGRKVSMKPNELERFSSIQAQRVGAALR